MIFHDVCPVIAKRARSWASWDFWIPQFPIAIQTDLSTPKREIFSAALRELVGPFQTQARLPFSSQEKASPVSHESSTNSRWSFEEYKSGLKLFPESAGATRFLGTASWRSARLLKFSFTRRYFMRLAQATTAGRRRPTIHDENIVEQVKLRKNADRFKRLSVTTKQKT